MLNMRRRTLGMTGLEVSELSLGGLFVSKVGSEDMSRSVAAIHRALDLGVNYIDTAPSYANSEEVIGIALEGMWRRCYISTKLGGRPQPFDPKSKDCLRRSVEESLRLLKRETITLLMIHEPDRPGQYDWWDQWDTFTGPVTDFLDELKQEGIIRFTGLGGTTTHEMARVIRSDRFDMVLTAFNYSLLWQEAAIEVIPTAKELGMGIVVGSPLQQGALAQRFDDEVNNGAPWLSAPRRAQYKKLYALLDDIDMSITDVAMRFVISNPDISTVLTGARSVEEMEKNVAAINAGPLPQDILDRLHEIAAEVPFRPFEEPFSLPFRRDYRGPGPA